MIKVNAKRRFCILPTLNIYRRGLEQNIFLHSITIDFVGTLADGAYILSKLSVSTKLRLATTHAFHKPQLIDHYLHILKETSLVPRQEPQESLVTNCYKSIYIDIYKSTRYYSSPLSTMQKCDPIVRRRSSVVGQRKVGMETRLQLLVA